MPKEKRIALIMGGGVSLGSFSGGALLQVLKLLPYVDGGPAKIDVAAGASAGSMTLGAVIYHLFRGSSLDDIERALRHVWIDAIDADGLRPSLHPPHVGASLFSDAVLHRTAGEIIDLRASHEDSAHAFFADNLRVSFALTNLNGMAARAEGQMIRQSTAGGGPVAGPNSVFADALQTTFHHDVMRFVVQRRPMGDDTFPLFDQGMRVLRQWESEDRAAGWDIFRQAGIASGAFPAAFPPVSLHRYRQEYPFWPDAFAACDDLKPVDDFSFDYLDGGILRNEPLREAIELAAVQDRGREHEVDRVFILIDPNLSGTGEAYALPFNQALAMRRSREWYTLEKPSYMVHLAGVLGRFAGMLATQATFRDWLKAARVNSQIEWRERLLELLPLLQARPGTEAETLLDHLIVKAYLDRARRAPADGSELPDLSSEQTARLFEILVEPDALADSQLALTGSQRRALGPLQRDLARRRHETEDDDGDPFTAKLLLLIDLIGNLRDKHRLHMVAITPLSRSERIPLAGNFLFGFGGFFHRSYREHDFQAGAHVADEVLRALIPNGSPDATRYARPFLREGIPAELRVPKPVPLKPDPGYGRLDPIHQQNFEGMIRRHILAVTAAARQMWLIRWFAGWRGGKAVRDFLRGSREGQVSYVRLRLDAPSGSWLEGFGGPILRSGRGQPLITVIGIRLDEDEEVLFGPHVRTGAPAEAILRFHQSPLDRRGTDILFQGTAEQWLRVIGRYRVPEILLTEDSLRGSPVIKPADVGEASAARPVRA